MSQESRKSKDHLYLKDFRFYGRTQKGKNTIKAVDLNDRQHWAKPRFDIGSQIQEKLDDIEEQLPDLQTDKTKRVLQKFTQTVQFAPKTKYYANALNEGAWNIYSFSGNVNYLNKAILLAKRALEFSEEPEIADTYARLLYKTGNKQEAILWEERAVNLIAKKGLSSNEFEKVLRSMLKDETKID